MCCVCMRVCMCVVCVVQVSGRDLVKRQRRDLLALLLIWGEPEQQQQQQQASPDGAAEEGAGDKPGEQQYDWEGWPGRAEFNAGLESASDQELTALIKVGVDGRS